MQQQKPLLQQQQMGCYGIFTASFQLLAAAFFVLLGKWTVLRGL
jgi:hypothetical protein